MDWIVVNRATGMSWRLRRAVLASVMALGAALLVGGGVAIGRALPTAEDEGHLLTAALQRDIAQQRKALSEAKTSAEVTQRALTERMAQLNAQLVRLEAASERVVTLANLDPKEFKFDEPAAVGGPDDAADASAQPAALPLLSQVDNLERTLEAQERQLRVLEDLLNAARLASASMPSGWPVLDGYVSSLFGWRRDPFSGRSAFHHGVDFAGPWGSDVQAVAGGTVSFAGDMNGYGRMVEINHGNGYSTRYGHASALKVKVGDKVYKQQVIALMGSSGRSTGPHVHFEVLVNGDKVDPARFVLASQ